MKLSASFGLLQDLYLTIQAALVPTLWEIFHSPSLIFRLTAVSRLFMAHVWSAFAEGADRNGRPTKENLITPNARGVVLDLGAGYGHTTKYLQRSRVSKYIALEPNVHMHPRLRTLANAEGYTESDGSLLILTCGAEDISTIISALTGEPHSVDTIISILTLCTIPHPQEAMTGLVREVLKPGGRFLFYEHVLSPRSDVAWWQRFWAPIWQLAFDGCRLDRPTHLWVDGVTVSDGRDGESTAWRERKLWVKDGQPEERLFWHQAGRFVKR
ncbi:S-adenosyl-L-methionine-dependent methyltransferase [Infundibulicybe gibba]|nr:S-adenosyl-L-methionine-dependent methyltransferase [Infundibulicybe gibba]